MNGGCIRSTTGFKAFFRVMLPYIIDLEKPQRFGDSGTRGSKYAKRIVERAEAQAKEVRIAT